MQVAIEQGLMILGWMESHTKEDVPPEHIWEDSDALERWWGKVKDRQERRVNGGRSRSNDDDSGGGNDDDDLSQNELARAFKE